MLEAFETLSVVTYVVFVKDSNGCVAEDCNENFLEIGPPSLIAYNIYFLD